MPVTAWKADGAMLGYLSHIIPKKLHVCEAEENGPQERNCGNRQVVVIESHFPPHQGLSSWNAPASSLLPWRNSHVIDPTSHSISQTLHGSIAPGRDWKGGLKSRQAKEQFYPIPSTAPHLHARRKKPSNWKNSTEQPVRSSGQIWPSKRQAGIESFILLWLYLHILELHICIVLETTRVH